MSIQNLTQNTLARNGQPAPNPAQSSQTDKPIHPRACLCPDCFFLPRVKDAEFYLHWVENRLAKSTPAWQEHWQQQLNYAWYSLNYWQRQYEADKTRIEAQL